MADKNVFIENIGRALGISSKEYKKGKRTPDLFPKLFSDECDKARKESTVDLLVKEKRKEFFTLMQQAAESLHLHCHYVCSFRDASECISQIIENSQPEFSDKKIVIQHDNADIIKLNLVERFSGSNTSIKTTTLTNKYVVTESGCATIGITAPQYGIAESATVIHQVCSGEPLSTSLLPSVHIALLRIENLMLSREEAYAALGEYPESSVVFISGPSKTADIEANLVLGAHGPKEMHCVVLDEEII